MEQLGKVCLKRLKRLREKANWKTKKERLELFNQLHDLIYNWTGALPNLWDIFRPEEMDWILAQAVKNYYKHNSKLSGEPIVKFVIGAGYKDRPEIDDDGKPLLRRTTAVHYAAKKSDGRHIVLDLFGIYDRFDVNYVDNDGLSHFHVACMYNCRDVVKKFLEFGEDPNSRVRQTGDSPLHLALSRECIEVVKLLLENGADPDSANKKGMTALHIISNQCYLYEYIYNELAEAFFKIIEGQRRTIQFEARDNLGRTPLELAVSTLTPELVTTLLDRGADISNLVFPTGSQLGEGIDKLFDEYYDVFKFRVASRVLAVLDCLEQRGYVLERGGVLAIMNFFLKHECFRRTSEATAYYDLCVYNGQRFETNAKKMMINPSLSLYELVRLRPGEAEKRLTYTDYYKFMKSQKIREIHQSEREKYVCTAYLNEIMARGFCRRGALDFFLELTHYRLPILCCERIFEYLGNEDFCRIGLATAVQTPKLVMAH